MLFQNISFTINEREHIGLIAKNGTGKSTLLSILAGKDSDDGGRIIFQNDLKIGYLEQSPRISKGITPESLQKNDEYTLRLKKFLTQMKITDEEISRIGEGGTFNSKQTLSGGQIKRIALAEVLASNPDLLILDEPTNHLDLEMIEWMESFLARTPVALLMVTHDRYFLDRVCSSIIEMDNAGIYTYKGNYSLYLQKRQERLDNLNAEIERANNLYRTELEWMRSTPCARSSKARYRIDSFHELENRRQQMTNVSRAAGKNVQLSQVAGGGGYIGSKIFIAHDVCKAFGEKVILKDFNYTFSRYEKMGIVGSNGTGKSTFVKMVLGLLPQDSGSIEVGETVRFGHYSQEGISFREDQRVIDAVRDIAEYVEVPSSAGWGTQTDSSRETTKISASQFLQHFLFSPEEQYSYIEKLSGGERRRLYLCTVLMRSPNFLILDEPTNDLDIVTLQILEEYLQQFRGCLIIISHDRYFMDKVVDHTLVFEGDGKITDFPGNYSQYREKMRTTSASAESKAQGKSNAGTQQKNNIAAQDASAQQPGRSTRAKLTYKEKQEFEQLSRDIERLETEKAELESALCGGTTSVERITEISKRLPLLKDELDEKELRWLELSEKA